MESEEPETTPLRTYAVRLTLHANRDRIQSFVWIADNVSDEIAREWLGGLRNAISSLATLPHRFPVLTKESRLIGLETRRLLYRRAGSSSATGHHIYYTVEEDSSDGPRVIVFHIRNAASQPINRKEARDLGQIE